jgi:hypothetical protein
VRAEFESPSPALLSPSFGAEIAWATSGLIERATGVRVSLAIARFDACPLRVTFGATGLSLRPCGALAGALLYAEGVGAPTPQRAFRPWVDAELWLRTRWDGTSPAPAGAWSKPERPRWFFAFDVGLVVPVTRPTFVFLLPRVVVHEVPPAGAMAALGAGSRF